MEHKEYSKDKTMMRCPGCNIGSDSGIRFNNCAGCGGKRYIKKPEFSAIEYYEKLEFERSWLFKQIDIYTWQTMSIAFVIGFLTATLIFI